MGSGRLRRDPLAPVGKHVGKCLRPGNGRRPPQQAQGQRIVAGRQRDLRRPQPCRVALDRGVHGGQAKQVVQYVAHAPRLAGGDVEDGAGRDRLPPFESSIVHAADIRWLRQVVTERALTRGDYLLSGGARSDYYIDKFRLFSDPQILRRIARMFVPVIAESNPDLIAGTELGGVIIATAVSQMTGLPLLVVRKQPKQYGAFAEEDAERPIVARQHVLLLEDVVTSGREVLAAKARLEELNLKVTVHAVISRGLAPVNSLIQFALPRGATKTDN